MAKKFSLAYAACRYIFKDLKWIKSSIRQLIKQQSAAILATHDVELAKLENEYPKNILNYHFDAQINGEELYFDYKLKVGVCTNMNASLLMKKIGLSL